MTSSGNPNRKSWNICFSSPSPSIPDQKRQEREKRSEVCSEFTFPVLLLAMGERRRESKKYCDMQRNFAEFCLC